MKHLALLTALTVLMAGCAHSQKEPARAVSPAPLEARPEVAVASQDLPRHLQMPLPYSFIRRGAEIRVNAVEFTPEQLLVNVSFKETRQENFELAAANLMKVRSASGDELPYEGFKRDGVLKASPTIPVNKEERFTIDLVYKRTAGSEGQPVTIQFPSGKWWSSK